MTTAPELTDFEWSDLTKRLTLYADRRLMRLYWRGVPVSKRGLPPGGMGAEDFAADAIERFLDGRRHWDRDKYPHFEEFLEGVIASRVNTLVLSVENRSTRPPPISKTPEGEESSFEDSVIAPNPGPDEVVASEELRVLVRAKMAKELGDDELAIGILECLDAGIDKPADIAEMTGQAVKDIYKAQKRFKRAVERVRKAMGERSGR